MQHSSTTPVTRQAGDPVKVVPQEWETPIPFGQFDLPDFPVEAFPRELCAISEFCAAVAESYQVPCDLPALLVLAVGGAALAKRIEVHIRGDWTEPVNLFIAVAMLSGERKIS